MTTEHRTQVKFQRGWNEWLASCSCGWVGDYVVTQRSSELNALRHIEQSHAAADAPATNVGITDRRATVADLITADEIAATIRQVDGSHTMGAGALGDVIFEEINRRLAKHDAEVRRQGDYFEGLQEGFDATEKVMQELLASGMNEYDPIPVWAVSQMRAAFGPKRESVGPDHG